MDEYDSEEEEKKIYKLLSLHVCPCCIDDVTEIYFGIPKIFKDSLLLDKEKRTSSESKSNQYDS